MKLILRLKTEYSINIKKNMETCTFSCFTTHVCMCAVAERNRASASCLSIISHLQKRSFQLTEEREGQKERTDIKLKR